MVRKIAGLLVLLFVPGLTMAVQDKKDAKKIDYTTVIGTFESYKNETLTLKVDEKAKKFKVPADTEVYYATDKDNTKNLKAKDHLKDVKKGSTVAVTLDVEGKKVLALCVTVPELPKDKPKDKDEESDKTDK